MKYAIIILGIGIFIALSVAVVALEFVVRRLLDHLPIPIAVMLVVSGCGADTSLVTPGQFSADRVSVEMLADGRNMTLLEPFAYTDSAGLVWTTPKGFTVDGATIPRVFWSVVGGPYEGKFRFASVIHDRYCRDDHGGRTWRATHRVFYEACIAGGTDPQQAKIMYAAIYHFGPRWGTEVKADELPALTDAPRGARAAQTPQRIDMERMRAVIESDPKISPHEIEDMR
jgi:hypothetical protein